MKDFSFEDIEVGDIILYNQLGSTVIISVNEIVTETENMYVTLIIRGGIGIYNNTPQKLLWYYLNYEPYYNYLYKNNTKNYPTVLL